MCIAGGSGRDRLRRVHPSWPDPPGQRTPGVGRILRRWAEPDGDAASLRRRSRAVEEHRARQYARLSAQLNRPRSVGRSFRRRFRSALIGTGRSPPVRRSLGDGWARIDASQWCVGSTPHTGATTHPLRGRHALRRDSGGNPESRDRRAIRRPASGTPDGRPRDVDDLSSLRCARSPRDACEVGNGA